MNLDLSDDEELKEALDVHAIVSLPWFPGVLTNRKSMLMMS